MGLILSEAPSINTSCQLTVSAFSALVPSSDSYDCEWRLDASEAAGVTILTLLLEELGQV